MTQGLEFGVMIEILGLLTYHYYLDLAESAHAHAKF